MLDHVRTLRFKLAALNLTVFGVILATLCMVVVTVREEYLREDFDERLIDRAQRMVESIEPTSRELAAWPTDRPRLNPYRFPGYYFQLRSTDGTIIERSSNLQDASLPLSDRSSIARRDGGPVLETYRGALAQDLLGPAGSMRLLTLYHDQAGGPPYYLQVGVSLARVNESVFKLRRLLVYLFVLGLLAVGVASWLMARRSLSPIGRIARQAKELTAARLDLRLDPPVGRDEVAEMVRTINDMLERLENAFSAQERFLADASHELKTPVTVLLGEAQVLTQQARTPEEYDRFITSVQDEMRLMARIVDSLMTLARADAGLPLAVQAPVSINEVVTDAVQRCQAIAQQREVRLLPELAMPESDVPDPTVRGDAALLQTMVENLIRNAIRFSNAGADVDIVVTQGPRTVTIVVRDRGPGIPAAQLERVFDRFYTLPTGQKSQRGTGLGLAIAKGVTMLHRGTITAQSGQPGGCAFEVSLPLQQNMSHVKDF